MNGTHAAEGRRHAKRLLLVGWDAADWKMIHPLIEQGRMPTLAGLMERGVWGNLATIRPILSPMLWNSIATGKRADKHGICGFVEPTPDGQGVRPASSTSRRCKAVWNILSQRGLSSIVVNWFASHPAEPIRGVVVSDRYAAAAGVRAGERELPEGTTHPPSRTADLERLIVSADILDAAALRPFLPNAAEIDQDSDDRVLKLARLVARTASVHAAASRLMMDDAWDFAAVYYDGIDQFGHVFMPYHPPRLPGVAERDVRLYGDVMNACYEFHDMMLATLLHHAGEDTMVLIVSDHGFHSGVARPGAVGTVDPEGWHRPFGIACLSGAGVKSGERLYGGTLLDVTPTILAALGQPVGGDMDGRPWVEAFATPAPPARVLSWEAIDGDDGMHAESLRRDPVADTEAMRHLVELGYLEAPGDDAQADVAQTLRDLKTNLALALTDSQRLRKAVPLWEELAATTDLDPQPYLLQLARCHLRLGELDACEAAIDRLSPAAQKNPVTLLTRAQVRLGQDRYAEALRLMDEARDRGGDDSALALHYGLACLRAGRLDAAEASLRQALAADEDAAAAWQGLAEVLITRGQFEGALEAALRAVGLTHQFPRAHLSLGRALLELGRDEEALAALQTALRMAPNLQEADRLLARLHKRGGEPGKAWRHELAGRPSALDSPSPRSPV